MENAVYKINKGVNSPLTFRGLIGQYIWYLGVGLVFLLLLFAVLYLLQLPLLCCLMVVLAGGTILFVQVYRMSNRYGEYGMLKKAAYHKLPHALKILSRQCFFLTPNNPQRNNGAYDGK